MHQNNYHTQFNCIYVALLPPFRPVLREVTTTAFSVNISWVIPVIVFDQENYAVQYGTDMKMLLSTSELLQGNSDINITNGIFSVNITGLTAFTTYYYAIVATNSVGSTSTAVLNFTANETGTYSRNLQQVKCVSDFACAQKHVYTHYHISKCV